MGRGGEGEREISGCQDNNACTGLHRWDPITVLMPTKAAMLPKAADRQCRLTVDALEHKFDAQVS